MQLFFILYEGRSGSTFLSRLISEKSKTFIPHESNFISTVLKSTNDGIVSNSKMDSLIGGLFHDEKFHDWELSKSEILDLFKNSIFPIPTSDFIERIILHHASKTGNHYEAIGIKKGSYLTVYDRLMVLFPNAKFICLMRDGRAVYNSQKAGFDIMNGQAFTNNPVEAAQLWKAKRILINKVMESGRSIKVVYEHLVTNTDEELKRILKFLNLKSQQGGTIQIAKRFNELHKNVAEGPKVNRIDDWKMELSKEEILLYEIEAYRALEEEGYDLLNSKIRLKFLRLFKFMRRKHAKRFPYATS